MADAKKDKLQIRNSTVDFLVFTKDAHEDGIEVRVQDHDVWLRLRMLFIRRTHSIWSEALSVSVAPSCFAIAETMISMRSLQAWSISARCRCSVPLVR